MEFWIIVGGTVLLCIYFGTQWVVEYFWGPKHAPFIAGAILMTSLALLLVLIIR